jgi:hypothetical protein
MSLAATTAMKVRHSRVEPPICGVITTLSILRRGLDGSSGSSSNVSRAAPAITSFFNASHRTRACVRYLRNLDQRRNSYLLENTVSFRLCNCSQRESNVSSVELNTRSAREFLFAASAKGYLMFSTIMTECSKSFPGKS